MLYSISHHTRFDFEEAQRAAVQRLHLVPVSNGNQRVLEWNIDINGGSVELETLDFHGNAVHLCRQDPAADSLTISTNGKVDVLDRDGIVGSHESAVPLALFKKPTSLSMPGPRLRKLAREIELWEKSSKATEPALMHYLSARILDAIDYRKGMTDVTTTAEQALEIGAGVCQDHVHAFMSVARIFGFPARYTSGYLMMETDTIQTASHAWAEVYLDGLGWVGYDVSNAISPDQRYIKLASGFDYADVVPISGVRIGTGSERISTSILVEQQ